MSSVIDYERSFEDLKLENEGVLQEIHKLKQKHLEEVGKLHQQIKIKDSEIFELKEEIWKFGNRQNQTPEEAGSDKIGCSKSQIEFQIRELDEVLRERDVKITLMENEMNESHKEMTSLEKEFANTDSFIKELVDKNERLEYEIRKLDEALRERDGKISFKEDEVSRSRKDLSHAKQDLLNIDSSIAELVDRNDRLEHEAMLYKELAEEKEEELTKEMEAAREKKDLQIRQMQHDLFDSDIKLARVQQETEMKIETLCKEYEETVEQLVKELNKKDADYLLLKKSKETEEKEVEKELLDTKVNLEQLQQDFAKQEEQKMAVGIGLNDLKKRLLLKKKKGLCCWWKGIRGNREASKLEIVQKILNHHHYASISSSS